MLTCPPVRTMKSMALISLSASATASNCARHAYADHRLPQETQLEWIGDRNNLHDTLLDEALGPLPDGRMSYATIAKQVGLSEAAVRQRAQRLIEQGVMQIVAVTDPLQLGFAWEAMVGVRVSGNIEAIADALGKIEAIDFIVLTGGKFDIILEVVAESDDQLIDLTNTIRSIPGVVGSETLVYLSTRKQAYSWGVR